MNLPNIIGVSIIDHNCQELLHIIIEKCFLKKTNILMPVNKSNYFLELNEKEIIESTSMLLREYVY